MTTPTLTSTMFKSTSHLNLSVPHITAIANVATGTGKTNKMKSHVSEEGITR